MGKSRDLFKKIRNTKGNFHAKMGKIKDRNGMDLTEAAQKNYDLFPILRLSSLAGADATVFVTVDTITVSAAAKASP